MSGPTQRVVAEKLLQKCFADRFFPAYSDQASTFSQKSCSLLIGRLPEYQSRLLLKGIISTHLMCTSFALNEKNLLLRMSVVALRNSFLNA
jgi:hypothetical protein